MHDHSLNIIKQVKFKIAAHEIKLPIWVAFSGGVDSHVLLHILSKILPRDKITAIHINHGISKNAKDWEDHCQNITKNLGIKFISKHINITRETPNLESVLRNKRFNHFCEIIPKDGTLCLGHHGNDQIETVLMRLIKGCGPHGLIGIKEYNNFNHINLFRPLLDIPKDIIREYASKQGLSWINDNSNNDNKFDRNFIRNDIVPVLEKRWPSLLDTVTRTRSHFLEQELFLKKQFQPLINEAIKIDKLNFTLLNKHDKFVQKYIIRTWINNVTGHPPTEQQLLSIQNYVISAKPDRTPKIQLKNKVLTRYGTNLYIRDKLENIYPSGTEIIWPSSSNSIKIEKYNFSIIKKYPTKFDKSQDKEIIVKFREGGERFDPTNRQGSHPVKKLMQEWKIPPWERNKIPLLYYKENLIAIAGFAKSKKHANQNIPDFEVEYNDIR